MNIGEYDQVWGALVPRNEGVPLAVYEFMAVWTLHPMYQQYRLPGSKSYLEHTCYIPSVMEWILAYMAKFGMPWFPETKASLRQIVILWQSGPCTLCTSNIGSLGQRAIWCTHVTYPLLWNEYWRIWHKFGVPCFPETKASFWQIVIFWQSGPCTLCTSNIGSLGQRAIWYTHVTYPLLWNEYWRIWPSLRCLGAQKRSRPSGRLWFYGSLDSAPYVPAISAPWDKELFVTHMLHTLCCGMNIGEYDQVWGALVPKKRRLPSGRLRLYGSLGPAAYVPAISAPWVKGLFGTHMLHTLCCGMNIGIYGLVYGALVPRNEGVPQADCEFIAFRTLYPMYQQYRLPGSEGYLVHTCYIPSVVEWILAYMASLGVPWFPETKASLWPIVILWQSGPCTPRTSNIGSLGQRAIWYTHVTYPLLWNEYWRLWPSLGCLGSQNRRRPSGRLWFYGSLVPAPYVPAISAP